ncbi:MAG: hypothetical protein FJ190_01700 [Gammaproteobacteria bacterium]|nr:hypothetical protein [Gammaproteobacteria bacterium]
MKLVLVFVQAILISACTNINRDRDLLEYLSIEECVDKRWNSSDFNKDKSHELLRIECKQLQAIDENHQKIANKRFRKNRKVTYPDKQEYFDEGAWYSVTERIRETYYPKYLSPAQEVEKANRLNEQQARLEDKSVQRVYEPRLLPVSPYLMSYRELEMAHEAVSGLIQENLDNKKLRRSLNALSVIVIKERNKKNLIR